MIKNENVHETIILPSDLHNGIFFTNRQLKNKLLTLLLIHFESTFYFFYQRRFYLVIASRFMLTAVRIQFTLNAFSADLFKQLFKEGRNNNIVLFQIK